MPFNINSLDRNCPYGRKFDWSVKNDYSAHDTQSAALGFDFQENPALFRKPVISLPANQPAPDVYPAPLPWVQPVRQKTGAGFRATQAFLNSQKP